MGVGKCHMLVGKWFSSGWVNVLGGGEMFPVGEEMFTCDQGKNYLWPQK